MQTVLGFLFDFKSNAGKTFKKVRAEIVKTTKDWGKQFNGMGKTISKVWKGVSLYTRAALGEFILFANRIKQIAPSISDVIGSIGDTFGGIAGIIADTLLRPGALVAGGLAVATRTAAGFSDTLVQVKKETALTQDEIDRLGVAMKSISQATRAPISQIEGLAKRFASANISLSQFNDLMTTAISMNRLSGQETSQYADEIQNMRIQLGMSSKDIKDFYNTLYGAQKATEVDLGRLSSMVPFITEQVKSNLPKELHKIGMESGIMMAAGLSAGMGEEAPQVVSKFFSVLMDKSNAEARAKLIIPITTLGNQAVEAFNQALEKGDSYKAFEVFARGIKNLTDDQLLSMKNVLGDVFGLSPETIKQLKNVNMEYYGMAKTMAEMAKSSDQITKDGKELLTTTQRWHKLWGDVERILLPFGEVLVTNLIAAGEWAGKLMKPIIDFVNGLDDAGKKAILLGLALATASLWMKPIVGIGYQIVNVFTSSGLAIIKMAKAAKAYVLALAASSAIASEGAGALAVGWGMVTLSIRGAITAVWGFITSAASVLWPILAITAAAYAVYEIFSMAFSPKIVDAFVYALKVALKVVQTVLWGVASIFAVIADAISVVTGGEGGNIKHWWNSLSDIWDDKPDNPAQKGSGKILSMATDKTVQETVGESFQIRDSVDPTQTNEIVNAQRETTAAQYEAAEMIIRALRSLGGDSPLFKGASQGQVRHLSVPEPSYLGGPK